MRLGRKRLDVLVLVVLGPFLPEHAQNVDLVVCGAGFGAGLDFGLIGMGRHSVPYDGLHGLGLHQVHGADDNHGYDDHHCQHYLHILHRVLISVLSVGSLLAMRRPKAGVA